MIEHKVTMEKVANMAPGPYHKRRKFKKLSMEGLVESIKAQGVVQPLIGRRLEGDFMIEIVAGQRRWKAAGKLGLEEVPMIIRELSDREAREICIVENLQREELDVIEEAEGFSDLMEMGIPVGEIAGRVGRSERYIYASVELLRLSDEGREALVEGNLSKNAARVLLQVEEEDRPVALGRIAPARAGGRPMTEAAAIELLREDFLEPAKRRKAWEKKRGVLEDDWPGAEVLPYEEALKAAHWNSGLVFADEAPGAEFLVGEVDEMLPTWGELARRHGAKTQVAVKSGEDLRPVLVLDPRAVVRAEQVLCAEERRPCLFGKVEGERDAPENEEEHKAAQLAIQKERRRKHEAEQARKAELGQVVEKVLTGGLNNRRDRALAIWGLKELALMFPEDLLDGLPGLPEDVTDWEPLEKWVRSTVTKAMKEGGLEGLGRVVACGLLVGEENPALRAKVMFEVLKLPKSQFPAMAGVEGGGDAG